MKKTASLFVLALLLCPALAISQELVPDPGFEQYRQLPSAEAGSSELLHWKNPSRQQTGLYFASADYLHTGATGQARGENADFGQMQPHSGQGFAGLLAWSQQLPGFREYLYTTLRQPLETGRAYTISFYASTGGGNPYGRLACSHLGVLLICRPPVQQGYQALVAQPRFALEKPVVGSDWQRFSFEFIADQPYTCLAIGNFASEAELQFAEVENGRFPCTYYFLDDVSLTEQPAPPETLAVDDTVVYQLSALDVLMRETLQGRTIDLQQSLEVSSVELELKVWDDRELDDDIISLNLNGEWILQQHKVDRRPLTLQLKLLPNQENYLVLFAHNVGAIPPNTAAISFIDKGKSKRLLLKSDLQTCGTLRLVYKP